MTVARDLRSLDDHLALHEERRKTEGKSVLKDMMAQIDDTSPHWFTLRHTECLDETARAAVLWYLDRIPAYAPAAANTRGYALAPRAPLAVAVSEIAMSDLIAVAQALTALIAAKDAHHNGIGR